MHDHIVDCDSSTARLLEESVDGLLVTGEHVGGEGLLTTLNSENQTGTRIQFFQTLRLQ